MTKKHISLTYVETQKDLDVTINKPTMRYMDDFLQCHAAPDMIEMGLFPNSKEITESFAAYRAAKKYLGPRLMIGDANVTLVAVGDGGTPRTAGTFAFRSRWNCFSVDPGLGDKTRWSKIARLTCIKKRIEDCSPEEMGITAQSRVVIVSVHSHATLEVSLKPFAGVHDLAVIAIPCCVKLDLDVNPDHIYDDWGIWSPERTVKVWPSVTIDRPFADTDTRAQS